MATISKIGDKYRVQIRKCLKKMNANFSDLETAEIWAKYNENLIDNMENFKVSPEKIITLETCIELKIKSFESRDCNKKTLQDFENCRIEFESLMNIPFGEITSDMIREITNKMLGSTVRRGGNKNIHNSGRISICSPSTILRKLRILSAVFGFIIEKGANITNPANIVVNQIKMSLIKKGQLEVDDE